MTHISTYNMEDSKLVFVVSQHPVFDYIIEFYQVRLNADQSFSLDSSKVNIQDARDGLYDILPGELEIIELINEYSEEAIVRRFYKKVEKFSVFIKKLSKEALNRSIKPYVEERVNKVIRLIISRGLKLYYKGHKKAYFTEKHIELPDEETKVAFNFKLADEGIIYQQSIKYGNERIELYGKEAVFLTEHPVCLYLDNRLHLFESQMDHKKLLPFFSKEHIVIPKTAINEYFSKFVYKIISRHDVEAEGFEIEELNVEPHAELEIKVNWQGEYMLLLHFRYYKKSLPFHHNSSSFVDLIQKNGSYVFKKYIRNCNKETAYYQKLKDMGLLERGSSSFSISASSRSTQESLYDLLTWVNSNSKSLLKAGFVIQQDALNKKYFTETIQLKSTFRDKPDWFDILIIVRFGDIEIPFSKLIPYIINGTREYVLPDSKVAVLPEEWFSNFRHLLLFAQQHKDGLKINKSLLKPQVLESFKNSGNTTELKELFSLTSLRQLEVPEKLKLQLRSYQQTGYSWMYHLSSKGFGCCLSDDMGLGKTAQTLALLLKESKTVKAPAKIKGKYIQPDLFEDNATWQRSTSLIVMPVSLLHNWVNEIHKFTPDLKYHVLEGVNRLRDTSSFGNYDLILSSYGILRNDIDIFSGYSFDFIILDESQLIKNPDSKTYKAVMQLKGARKIVLTGTPVENSLSDLWAQMNFINPGLLGDTQSFKNEFILPVEKDGNELQASKLKNLIHPFILRRTKEEVAKDLPALSENIRYCEMTEAQHRFYEERKSEIRNYLMQHKENHPLSQKMIMVLKALMTLRLASNHPSLTQYPYDEDSGKFNEITGYMEELLHEKHKLLVFSSFVKHLNLYAQHLDAAGIPYALLTGSTGTKQREKIISAFQNDEEKRIFLLSIKAGGIGLNLTAADYVFILDPWWNPAVEMQAFSRAHRIGQDKKVFVYRFITRSSIEEKILALQAKKKWLAQEFINSNNPLKVLSEREIEELFL